MVQTINWKLVAEVIPICVNDCYKKLRQNATKVEKEFNTIWKRGFLFISYFCLELAGVDDEFGHCGQFSKRVYPLLVAYLVSEKQ